MRRAIARSRRMYAIDTFGDHEIYMDEPENSHQELPFSDSNITQSPMRNKNFISLE